MSSVKAVAGSEVTIWCPYYGFPIDSVKWEGGVGADPRYQQVDGQLTISNVDHNRDKGVWTCSVITPGGELAKREAGDRSQITCTVTSGDMPVYFSWLKDQMPISTSLQVDERGAEFFSMLLFKSLTAAHSGVYTCVVTNTAGKANPSDAAVLLNSSLTISCDARGHPTPTIYWTKFSGSTETSLGGILDPVVLGNGSLRLESARAEHSGKYRCRADNGVPPDLSKTLNIHVNEPARFETQSVNVTAKLGDTVRISCVARGDTPLSTTWKTRSAEGLRSELVVERTDRRDSGVYRCQASNPYGRSDHFVHLAVQVRLQWRRPYDGNSPVLGYMVQYRKHDSTSADSWRDADTHNVMEGATISGLEPATAYLVRARTVTAQFASSHTRALLALTLHEPPSRAPLKLLGYTVWWWASADGSLSGGANVGMEFATVRGQINKYTIEGLEHYTRMEGATISGLEPATAYLVRARTVTAQFASSHTRALLALTLHEPPSRAPLIWWWASADGSLSGGANVGMEFATVRGQINKYTIEGLEHYTRYSISVRAFNSAGAGPASLPVNTLTKESVPSEGPRGVRCRAVSPQSLKVEWSPPPAHAHHGALLGYKLLYRPEYTANWLEWEVRGSGGLSTGAGAEVKRVAGVETLLLALRPHMNYTIQALAYTTGSSSGGESSCDIRHLIGCQLATAKDRPPQTTTVQAENSEPSVGLGGSTELRSGWIDKRKLHLLCTKRFRFRRSFTIWWIRVRDDTAEGMEPASPREEERRLEAGGEAASVVLRALSCGATYSEEIAEAAVWSNSSALALDARRAVRCGARLVRLQWRRADAVNAAAWRDADLTSLHHHREICTLFFVNLKLEIVSKIIKHKKQQQRYKTLYKKTKQDISTNTIKKSYTQKSIRTI
ncbi:Uncharacterized protein OBRU01_16914, partial [Operophtera brumata]